MMGMRDEIRTSTKGATSLETRIEMSTIMSGGSLTLFTNKTLEGKIAIMIDHTQSPPFLKTSQILKIANPNQALKSMSTISISTAQLMQW